MNSPAPALVEAARSAAVAALAVTDLAGFVAASSADTGYRIGRWHQRLCDHLEDFLDSVMAGDEPRLIIEAPPRHGKTEIVGRSLGPCFMARRPGAKILYATHTQNPHADMVSMDARRKVEEHLAPHLPHMRRDEDRKWTRNLWQTATTDWLAVGAGVGTAGMGAHLAIVDDPFGSAEDVRSPATRERVWRWFQYDIESRIMDGGGIVVMHTRWHEDDLVGRLMSRQPGTWRRLSWPAVAEVGEPGLREEGGALVPHLYSRKRLDAIRGRVGSRAWASLYQQRPNPEGGGSFKREWWFHPDGQERNRYTGDTVAWARTADEVVVSVDSSAKGNDNSDFNAIQVLGRKGAEVRLLERHKRRMEYPEFEATLDAVHERWEGIRTSSMVEEAGHGNVYIQRRRAQVWALKGFVPTRDTPGKGKSKEDRAAYVVGPAEAGQYLLPRACDAPWVEDYLETLLGFPAGANDDEVDATSMPFVRWRHAMVDDDDDWDDVPLAL